MRLDDVEVKVSFGGDQTARAVEALGLAPQASPWRIHFCEDVAAGVLAGTPLLDRRIALRARVRPGDDDDSTVKLRPGRRSQLTDRWLATTKKLKIEADWAGSRHLLAVSHTEKRPEGLIDAVARGERPLSEVFTEEQLTFLAECGEAAVNLDTLTLLRPVRAVRWKTVDAAPAELSLRAERWTVDALDFLELSLVAPLEEAPRKQAALGTFIESLGLDVDPDQETKTRLVMDHLVEVA